MSYSHENPKDIHGKPFNRSLLVAVILVGAFVTILNQTLLSTALPTIMSDLDITASTGQWLTTAFMLVNGIMIPLTALLINKINSKTLFLIAMVLFAIGTVFAAIADSFAVLLIGRIIQAMGAGIMMPLLQTIFLLIFPVERRGAAMGLVGLVIAFAPAIGPTISGWIVDTWDWHYLFFIVLPIAVLDIIFAFFAMRNVVPLTKPKIDILSIILSTIGFGSILYGFSSAGNDGWSDGVVIGTLLIGVLGIVAFIWRQLTMAKPMLEFRVFKSPTYALTTAIGAILNMAMLGASIILPIYIQSIHGKSALFSGLVLLPGAILMGVMGPITGRIFDKFGARWLALTGLTILVVSTIPFMNLGLDTSMGWIAFIYAARFFGISMVMMPLTTAGINSLPNSLISHGTAVNNTLRTVAGSVGTAILVTIMTNVTESHSPDASLAVTNKASYMKKMADAAVDGINGSFIFTFVLCMLALLMTFFLKDRRKVEIADPKAKSVSKQ
ncbi:MDR family MFS transporter [Bacillus testis]|uniref:MDR family MFS transporter n=1 Tax=Bacillus testis TaxID=1622072 RepID=UPI00067F263D|nr:MDR family MFS transporter [Bacillus testis]